MLQGLAAHVCYLVAGALPGFWDDGDTRYCLLGMDHSHMPRAYASVLALQRTQVVEWVRQVATAAGEKGSGKLGHGTHQCHDVRCAAWVVLLCCVHTGSLPAIVLSSPKRPRLI